MPSRKRSITDEEIALIKGLLARNIEKTKIQAYFTHPDRPVNFGRVTNIVVVLMTRNFTRHFG